MNNINPHPIIPFIWDDRNKAHAIKSSLWRVQEVQDNEDHRDSEIIIRRL